MERFSVFLSGITRVVCLLMLFTPHLAMAQELTKLPFPYGPLGLNSLPWVVAKDVRLFERNGLDVEMVYIGASAVIVQSIPARLMSRVLAVRP